MATKEVVVPSPKMEKGTAIPPGKPAESAVISESDKSASLLVARMERVPITNWHQRARLIVGGATFFDAFDALSISFILPVLIPLWKLAPTDIGFMISSGYVGQAVGAVFFGWLAERKGRLFSLQLSVIVFALFSLGCMIAQDYTQLFTFRLIQGFGLGGEVPVAGAYVNEMIRAKGRGRFVLIYEWAFALGIWLATILSAFIVPNLGWRFMFLIGAIPAVLLIFMRRTLPESPRWLANHGELERAEEAVKYIENQAIKEKKPLPEPEIRSAVATKKTRFMELFEGVYFKRTIAMWFMWAGSYLYTYGLYQTWGPTIYTQIFKLSVPDALNIGAIISTINLPISFVIYWNIDRIPRRVAFITSLIGGGLILGTLGMLSATGFLTLPIYIFLIWLTGTFVGINNLGLYLYNPEVYPTRLRALGTSIATMWLRVASAIGPTVTGIIVASSGLTPVFFFIAVGLLLAGVVAFWGAPETRNKVLEEVSA